MSEEEHSDGSEGLVLRRRKPGGLLLLPSDEEIPVRKTSKVTLNEDLTVFIENDASLCPSGDRLLSVSPPRESTSFVEYFWEELTRGYSVHNEYSRYTEKRRKVYAFLRIPYELEYFMFYGILQCIDAFAYLFTFLPIRFVMSIVGVVCRLRQWTSAETCDLLKMLIILFSSFLMQYIDTSMLYHQVRSQGVIKLYIFYNMLEVGDKLFSSLGQDILEALMWTANEQFSPRNLCRTFVHLLFAVVYATMHTFIVLLQATTLNVAFNSHNQALLAIMMSNNFVELKGSVFKKFAKANLFQMACSDVRERFHIFALLCVVVLRNMMGVNWNMEKFSEMIPDLIMVVFAELIVDWFKHAFITKFNEINAQVYRDFTITIAFDVVKSREESAFSDYSDQVSRRMGFIPIPLSIMLIRVVTQTFSFHSFSSLVLLFLSWLFLLSIKLSNGMILLGQACHHVAAYRDLQEAADSEEYRKRIVEQKSKSAPSSPKISLVDFSDVCNQTAQQMGRTVSDWMEELQNKVAAQEERTPRRTQSLANIPRSRRRDKSLPPATIPEGEERGPGREDESSKEEEQGQMSPKKRANPSTSECEALSEVTAYTMLSPDRGVERIE